jgi:hypothetical protein
MYNDEHWVFVQNDDEFEVHEYNEMMKKKKM